MKNETTYQTVLGRLIAHKRKENQIDQNEMARRVGINRSTWSRIEAGSSSLNIDQLAKAASALGVSLGALMQEVDGIVRALREQNVEVHDSRDQARVASVVGGVSVAFLAGGVLAGIIGTIMRARQNTDDEHEVETPSQPDSYGR